MMKYLLLALTLAAVIWLMLAPARRVVPQKAAPVTVANTVAPGAAAPQAAPSSTALLAEDFEQVEVGAVPASVRPHSGQWSVQSVDGKKVLRGEPAAGSGDGVRGMFAFGRNDWQEHAVSFRFRYAEKPEAIVLRVRCEGKMNDYYNLHLDQEKGLLAAFVRNAWHMVKYDHTLPAAHEWHRYSAVCRERSVQVTINGTTVIDAPVEVPIKGQCELFIVKGALLVDDLRVMPLDQPAPAKSDGGDF